MSRCDFHRFTVASACCGQLVGNDHKAVGCRLCFSIFMQRKPPHARSTLTQLDTAGHLSPGSERERKFAGNVTRRRRVQGRLGGGDSASAQGVVLSLAGAESGAVRLEISAVVALQCLALQLHSRIPL